MIALSLSLFLKSRLNDNFSTHWPNPNWRERQREAKKKMVGLSATSARRPVAGARAADSSSSRHLSLSALLLYSRGFSALSPPFSSLLPVCTGTFQIVVPFFFLNYRLLFLLAFVLRIFLRNEANSTAGDGERTLDCSL